MAGFPVNVLTERQEGETLAPMLLLALLFTVGNSFAAGNEKIRDFNQAKKLALELHLEHPFTIYCNCRYSGKTIDLESCGYKIHKDEKRARRLEWEHVVPAENFGRAFVEWRSGSDRCVKKGKHFKGRRCAKKNSEFSHMEGDLYNLWPEVGELNGLRNNYSMEALGGPEKNPEGLSFGGCRAVVAGRKFEPMDQAKGIVARVYLYMDQSYPGKGIISGKNRQLFDAWNKMFPPESWECRRAEKIRAIQGNENSFVTEACALARKK